MRSTSLDINSRRAGQLEGTEDVTTDRRFKRASVMCALDVHVEEEAGALRELAPIQQVVMMQHYLGRGKRGVLRYFQLAQRDLPERRAHGSAHAG